MPLTHVAINGFGRIGRLSLRALLQQPHLTVVAINDLAPAATLAHLLKYDSTHGRFPGTVTSQGSTLIVNNHPIHIHNQPHPAHLPWQALRVGTVVEATGQFRDRASAAQHLAAGAQQVVLSAPAQGKDIPTVVLGINDELLDQGAQVISNASCTTHCLAPMALVLEVRFGIVQGYVHTVHAYTADQHLQDGPHKDWRRGRAAATSIIPTTTGAAQAMGQVLPELQGKLDGMASRVPVASGSMVDLTVVLKKPATKATINQAMQAAAKGKLQEVLAYTEDPIVSVDVLGSTHACVFDAQLTAVQGSLARVVGWYDNEMGYAHRLAALVGRLASNIEE